MNSDRLSYFILFLSTLLLLTGCSDSKEESPPAAKPGPSEVEFSIAGSKFKEKEVTKVSVNIVNHPEGGQDIPEFELPVSFHGSVLKFIDGGESFSVPIDPKIRGTVKITTETEEMELMLFCPTPSDEIIYNSPGGKFKAGSLREFVRTVEKARAAIPEP